MVGGIQVREISPSPMVAMSSGTVPSAIAATTDVDGCPTMIRIPKWKGEGWRTAQKRMWSSSFNVGGGINPPHTGGHHNTETVCCLGRSKCVPLQGLQLVGHQHSIPETKKICGCQAIGHAKPCQTMPSLCKTTRQAGPSRATDGQGGQRHA